MKPDPDLWNDSTSVDSGDLISSARRVGLEIGVEVEEEPTMRADTESLRRAGERPGTLDEPTVERRSEPARPPRDPAPLRTSPMRKQDPPGANNEAAGRLIVEAGNDNGRTFELTGASLTIGRALGNSIVLTDIAVSRKHLSLEFDGRQYKLIDHASGNGTLINGRLETGTCLLRHDDRLELGNTVFRLEHPASRNAHVSESRPPETEEFDDERVEAIARSAVSAKLPNPPIPSRKAQPAGRPATPGRRRKPITLPPPHSIDALALPRSNSGLPLGNAHNQSQSGVPLPSQPQVGPHSQPHPGPLAAMRSVDSSGHGVPQRGLSASGIPPSPSIETLLPGPRPRIPTADDYGMDPSHPMFATGPGAGGTNASIRPSNRKLIVGLLVASVLAVLLAISVLLTRGSDSEDTELAASDGVGESTDPGAATASNKPDKTLPETTWGTNETVLVASIGTSVIPKAETASKDSSDSKPKPDAKPDAKPDTKPDAKPEAKPDAKPDTKPAATGTEKNATDTKTKSATKTKVASKAPAKKPVRTATKRRKPTRKKKSTSNVAASKKTAASQYRGKKFSTAGATLRKAAKRTSGKTAKGLLSTAGSYEKVGSLISKGNSNQARNPVTALSVYDQAYRLDKRVGGGAHSSFLRGKLSVVAPKAAASHMAKGRYEAAKRAADKAASFGSGSSSMVKRVRQGLETKAKAFYKSALKKKSKQPAQAKKTLQRILKMVPSKSPSYTKAHKLLSKLG